MDIVRRFSDEDANDVWSKKEFMEYTAMILNLSTCGPITMLASVLEIIYARDQIPFYECTWYAVRDNIKLRTTIGDDDRGYLLNIWDACTGSVDTFNNMVPTYDQSKYAIMEDTRNLPFIRAHHLRDGGGDKHVALADSIEHMQRMMGLI